MITRNFSIVPCDVLKNQKMAIGVGARWFNKMVKNTKCILIIVGLIIVFNFTVWAKPKHQYVFKLIKPVDATENGFTDNFIRIGFVFLLDGVNFTLCNKSEQPIKIHWNDVSYIDAAGNSHRVMHSGIKFDERNQDMPAISIPPTSKIADLIVPSDYVYLDKGGIGAAYYGLPAKWTVTPFFPPPDKKEALEFVGRTVEVFMPIETSDGLKNYRFTFQIGLEEMGKK